MRVFVPKEIKTQEYRVGLLPEAVKRLTSQGHQLFVESGAGAGIAKSDDQYESAGAQIVDALTGFEKAEMVVKVKEPLPTEYPLLRPGQIVFGYFHFAADQSLTEAMMRAGITAVAYETLVDEQGRLPLLTPMSEVAGRLSVQLGARLLERPQGGRGILLGGVTGVPPAHVTILGGGVVGTEAAKMAAGLGAHVHLLDTNVSRLRVLSELLPKNVMPLHSSRERVLEELHLADLVIGAVLIVGAKAPHLIFRSDLDRMKKGAVVVDVAIDQGGCTEFSRPTTHDDPYYLEHGILVSCVANLPGAVSHTSTRALANATFPYVEAIANYGFEGACERRPELASSLNIMAGQIRHRGVADAFSFSLLT